MKAQRTRSDYALPISVDNFLKISKYEINCEYDEQLNILIDKLPGVHDCDYNGHFGAFIYYKVEVEYDKAKTHNIIEKLVYEQIKKGS